MLDMTIRIRISLPADDSVEPLFWILPGQHAPAVLRCADSACQYRTQLQLTHLRILRHTAVLIRMNELRYAL